MKVTMGLMSGTASTLLVCFLVTATVATAIVPKEHSPFTATEVFYPSDTSVKQLATIGTTFLPDTGTFTDSPADDTAVFACGSAMACVAKSRSDAVVASILDSDTTLDLGYADKFYAPVISGNATLQAEWKQRVLTTKCSLGFETGRGIDLDAATSNLPTFGVSNTENRTQAFTLCNQHRLGVYPFQFHAAGALAGTVRNGLYIKTYVKGAKAVFLTGEMHQRTLVDGVTRVWIHPRDTSSVQLQFTKASTVPKSRDAYIAANPSLTFAEIVDDGWYHILLVGANNAYDFSALKYHIVVEYEASVTTPYQFSEHDQALLSSAIIHAQTTKNAKCNARDADSLVAANAMTALLASIGDPYDYTYNTIGGDIATRPNISSIAAFNRAISNGLSDWAAAGATLAGFDANTTLRTTWYTATETSLVTQSKTAPADAMTAVQAIETALTPRLHALQLTINSVEPRLIRAIKDVRILQVAVIRDPSISLNNATAYIDSFDLPTMVPRYEALAVEYNAMRNVQRFIDLAQAAFAGAVPGDSISGDSYDPVAVSQQYMESAVAQLTTIEHLDDTSRTQSMAGLYVDIDGMLHAATNTTTAKRGVGLLVAVTDYFNTTVTTYRKVGDYNYLLAYNQAREKLATLTGETNACQWCQDIRASGAVPTLTADMIAALNGVGCAATVGACTAHPSFSAVRAALQSAVNTITVSTASALTLRGKIDATLVLQNQVFTDEMACDAANANLLRLQAIQDDPNWRRYFAQIPHIMSGANAHDQAYTYDPSTDLLPWHTAISANLPVQKLGVLPDAVGSQTAADDAITFVPTPKDQQIVYRIDLVTFTTGGTFQAALSKLSADASTADVDVAFYNTIQLAPVLRLVTQPYSTDDTRYGAFGPVEVDPALDADGCGACGLKAFVDGCHALGYTVLIETQERDLLLNTNAASAYFQVDWIWETVDLSLDTDATAFVVFPNRTFVQTGGFNGTYVLNMATSAAVQAHVIRAHDYFLLQMHADGVVHQLFGVDAVATQVCALRPSNLALVNVPVGQRCQGNQGAFVLQHYASALATLASGARTTTFVVYSDYWPCTLRSAELQYHVGGVRPSKYHTNTGAALISGCLAGTPTCLFENVDGGITGINDTRVNLEMLAFNDPSAYVFTVLPQGLDFTKSRALVPDFEIATDAAHSPYDYAIRYLGYNKLMRNPDWLRLYQRTRLLDGNTPVFFQGFEVLNSGWSVSPLNSAVLGTSQAGSVSQVLALRATQPDFFNASSTRRVVTPGRYAQVDSTLRTRLEKNLRNTVIPPGARLSWLVSAPPGVCARAALAVSSSLDAPCDQSHTVDEDSDGMPDVWDSSCVVSRMENYISGSNILQVPQTDTDLVHVLFNHDDAALTFTINVRDGTRPVFLVGSAQQCSNYNNDVSSTGDAVQTPTSRPLKTAVFDPALKCKLTGNSFVAFKMVTDYQIPVPSALTLDGTELYEVAELDPIMAGLTKNHSALWTKSCPPTFDWAAHENCTASVTQHAVSVVLGVRSGRETSVGVGASPSTTVPVECPITMQRSIDTGLCSERRLGATSFTLTPSGSGPQGIMVQEYMPVTQPDGSHIVSVVKVEFIRLLLATATVGSAQCPTKNTLVSPNLVRNMTRDGDFVLWFGDVTGDLLGDIDDGDKPSVRLEFRYTFNIASKTGAVTTVSRVSAYSRDLNVLRLCDGKCSTESDPYAATTDTVTQTSVEGNVFPGGVVRPMQANRLYARLQWDAYASDKAAAVLPGGADYYTNHKTRLIYEHVPQLSLKMPANGNLSTWRNQAPGSNVYDILQANYMGNLSITDVQLTGMFSAHEEIAASTYMPFVITQDLNPVRLGTNEWRRGGIAVSSADSNIEWLSETPMGTDPACTTLAFEDQVDTQLYGVPANLSTSWNAGFYIAKRRGIESSKQLSALEYSVAAKGLGKRVLVSVSWDNMALDSPLFKMFEQDPSAAYDPKHPPSLGGGVYFYNSPSAAGVTDDSVLLNPEGLRYSVSGCVSNQDACDLRPRPNLKHPMVQQMILDQLRFLLDKVYVDGIILDISYMMDTDPIFNSRGVVTVESIMVPGAAELLSRVETLVKKGYKAATYYSTEGKVSAPGDDWRFVASMQARKLKNLDLHADRGVDRPDRVVFAESSLQVVNAIDRIASYNHPCIDCLQILPHLARSSAVRMLAGQELLATRGTMLPGYAIDPWDGATRWTSRDSWLTNAIPAIPRITVNSATANGTASNMLLKMQQINALKNTATSGFSGERISVFQNCTTVLSIRKWRGNETEKQKPVYVLMNSVVLPDTSRVVSWKVAATDAHKLFRVVFASGPHDGCASLLEMGDAGAIMTCILPAKTVIVYQAETSFVVGGDDDTEVIEHLPMMEVIDGELVAMPEGACDQAPIVPGEKGGDGELDAIAGETAGTSAQTIIISIGGSLAGAVVLFQGWRWYKRQGGSQTYDRV